MGQEVIAKRAPLGERVVGPCGCLFQAVSKSDECWACGRSAAAVWAEQDRIIADIRGLPELGPSA
jgi:hypothetical protein